MAESIRDKIAKKLDEFRERAEEAAEVLRRRTAGQKPQRAPVPVRASE